MDKPNFERMYKVLLLDGEPDRIPFYDLFADLEVMEAIVGEKIPARGKDISQHEDILKRYLMLNIKFHRKLGYDYVVLGIPSPFPRDNVILSDDTAPLPREKRRWQDENRGVIETREDFERYPWPDLDRIQEIYMLQYEFLKRNLPDGMMIISLTPGGVLENVMWLMGAIPFFRALYRDPSLVEDMFSKVGKVISYYCGLASEGGMIGALTMGDDMGYKNGPMISPEMLRKYVFPWQKRCVEKVHKHGKPFILHSCGNLKVVMDDIINYVGIDAKHSFEDTSYPVIEYKRLYGEKIAILGGVDMDKLSRMPNREFREYVRRIIRECAPGGGYALGCGNSVANYVDLKNYLSMLEMGRIYGRYPRIN